MTYAPLVMSPDLISISPNYLPIANTYCWDCYADPHLTGPVILNKVHIAGMHPITLCSDCLLPYRQHLNQGARP